MFTGGRILTLRQRLKLQSSTLPQFAVRYRELRYPLHNQFLKTVMDTDELISPLEIVKRFNNNPNRLKNIAAFTDYFVKNSLVQYPQFSKNPSDWLMVDKRTIIAQKKTDSGGHYIYSGTFEPNQNPDLVKNPNLAVHFISAFPAGGGYLIPKELYLESVADGRGMVRFPATTFDKYTKVIQDYNAKVYKENRPLEGEIVILGNNAVQIANHSIFEHESGSYNILRPVTLNNHIFHDGHAMWVSAKHKAFSGGTVHMYLGHGLNNVSLGINLGDRFNSASGVGTFKDVFRIGLISAQQFSNYLELFGDNAYQLGVNKDYAMKLFEDLAKEDPLLAWDIKLLTLLDNTPLADLIRFRNFTPEQCKKPLLADEFLATSVEAVAGECDIYDVDLDDLTKKIESGEIDSVEKLLSVLDSYPITTLDEGLYQEDGTPYPIDLYNEMLSMPRDKNHDVFLQSMDELLGEPIDNYISDLVRKSFGSDFDWSSVQDSMKKAIENNVQELVEALKPFDDGATIDSLARTFSTQDFQDSIQAQLKTKLSEAIGSKLNSFYAQVMADSLFSSASNQVQEMMKNYSFIDAVTNQVLIDMTTVGETGVSYFQSRMKEAIANEKKKFFEQPEQKENAQKQIAEKLRQLGDVSNLDRDLATTSQELEKSQASLESVNQQLLDTPDDPSLKKQKEQLEREINEKIKEQEELQDKKTQLNELNQSEGETDPRTLEHEGSDAGEAAEKSGEHIFRK